MGLPGMVLLAIWLVVVGIVPHALAQKPDVTVTQRPEVTTPPDTTPLTMFPHSPEGRYWISGQANFIYQTNPPFDAEYSGPNSFKVSLRQGQWASVNALHRGATHEIHRGAFRC